MHDRVAMTTLAANGRSERENIGNLQRLSTTAAS
jgi:hypothetical protein